MKAKCVGIISVWIFVHLLAGIFCMNSADELQGRSYTPPDLQQKASSSLPGHDSHENDGFVLFYATPKSYLFTLFVSTTIKFEISLKMKEEYLKRLMLFFDNEEHVVLEYLPIMTVRKFDQYPASLFINLSEGEVQWVYFGFVFHLTWANGMMQIIKRYIIAGNDDGSEARQAEFFDDDFSSDDGFDGLDYMDLLFSKKLPAEVDDPVYGEADPVDYYTFFEDDRLLTTIMSIPCSAINESARNWIDSSLLANYDWRWIGGMRLQLPCSKVLLENTLNHQNTIPILHEGRKVHLSYQSNEQGRHWILEFDCKYSYIFGKNRLNFFPNDYKFGIERISERLTIICGKAAPRDLDASIVPTQCNRKVRLLAQKEMLQASTIPPGYNTDQYLFGVNPSQQVYNYSLANGRSADPDLLEISFLDKESATEFACLFKAILECTSLKDITNPFYVDKAGIFTKVWLIDAIDRPDKFSNFCFLSYSSIDRLEDSNYADATTGRRLVQLRIEDDNKLIITFGMCFSGLLNCHAQHLNCHVGQLPAEPYSYTKTFHFADCIEFSHTDDCTTTSTSKSISCSSPISWLDPKTISLDDPTVDQSHSSSLSVHDPAPTKLESIEENDTFELKPVVAPRSCQSTRRKPDSLTSSLLGSMSTSRSNFQEDQMMATSVLSTPAEPMNQATPPSVGGVPYRFYSNLQGSSPNVHQSASQVPSLSLTRGNGLVDGCSKNAIGRSEPPNLSTNTSSQSSHSGLHCLQVPTPTNGSSSSVSRSMLAGEKPAQRLQLVLDMAIAYIQHGGSDNQERFFAMVNTFRNDDLALRAIIDQCFLSFLGAISPQEFKGSTQIFVESDIEKRLILFLLQVRKQFMTTSASMIEYFESSETPLEVLYLSCKSINLSLIYTMTANFPPSYELISTIPFEGFLALLLQCQLPLSETSKSAIRTMYLFLEKITNNLFKLDIELVLSRIPKERMGVTIEVLRQMRESIEDDNQFFDNILTRMYCDFDINFTVFFH